MAPHNVSIACLPYREVCHIVVVVVVCDIGSLT